MTEISLNICDQRDKLFASMLAERDIIFQKKINKIADQQKIIMQTQGSSSHSKLLSGQDERTPDRNDAKLSASKIER